MTDSTLVGPLVWATAIGVLGAIFGSFIAALLVRWPDGRTMGGRSACDSCGRTLSALDLVPIVSAIALRGRCRGCGTEIAPLHWRVEVLALVIGAVAGWVAPGGVGVAGAVFGWLLLALGGLDLITFWLPDRLTGMLAVAGLVGGVAGLAPDLSDRLIGGVAGFGALWLIALAYRRVRGREGMGGGDPKLLGAIGLWLGWRMLPAVLLLACLIGLGVVLAMRITGRAVAADTALPLGTLMAVAAYPAWVAMIVVAS
ncbi:peptidase A24 [Sphingomonas sp. Leaf17]|uniref:prepilin peptidase n=1 Tax=Sphingomonas sp. Leaf17 TaxID=1735683 RepID=UPI0006FEBD26|nr:A24 family peptidase [Sphingomonas sp. Leaf17]KQM63628.1 peptidase A24 [Sphingomonas sp. Leaf17]